MSAAGRTRRTAHRMRGARRLTSHEAPCIAFVMRRSAMGPPHAAPPPPDPTPLATQAPRKDRPACA